MKATDAAPNAVLSRLDDILILKQDQKSVGFFLFCFVLLVEQHVFAILPAWIVGFWQTLWPIRRKTSQQ